MVRQCNNKDDGEVNPTKCPGRRGEVPPLTKVSHLSAWVLRVLRADRDKEDESGEEVLRPWSWCNPTCGDM